MGLGEHIDLPQLVVVGDQSSGKSSVLEAISGIKFPTNDGFCTTFATELVLRHAETNSASVVILPHSKRTPEDRLRLIEFTRGDIGLEDIPSIIQLAKAELQQCSNSNGDTIYRDTLRVTISQSGGPTLSVVDLPGIFYSASGDQTAQDVETVSDLAHEYMKNSRCIILAVTSAGNDHGTQAVLTRAHRLDGKGLRTIGVLTKPDLTNDGSDRQKLFLNLASNKLTPYNFDLGWHVLRNRDFTVRST